MRVAEQVLITSSRAEEAGVLAPAFRLPAAGFFLRPNLSSKIWR